jgi:hypothetical protein
MSQNPNENTLSKININNRRKSKMTKIEKREKQKRLIRKWLRKNKLTAQLKYRLNRRNNKKLMQLLLFSRDKRVRIK